MVPPDRPTRPGRPTPQVLGGAVLAAAVLGALALLADAVRGPIGTILVLVASTGLAWGAASLIVGANAARPLAAAAGGATVMVGAVFVYYGGAAVLGLRPTSSSLIRAGVLWGGLAILAGPTLGLLGWHAVRTTGRLRSGIWGVVGGLLLSQAVSLLFRVRGGLFEPGSGVLWLLLLVALSLSVAIVVVGSRRRHLGWAFASMLGVAMLGAAGWLWVGRAL